MPFVSKSRAGSERTENEPDFFAQAAQQTNVPDHEKLSGLDFLRWARQNLPDATDKRMWQRIGMTAVETGDLALARIADGVFPLRKIAGFWPSESDASKTIERGLLETQIRLKNIPRRLEAMALLIELGCDPKEKVEGGDTLLMLAIREFEEVGPQVVELLIPLSDLDEQNNSGDTALFRAVQDFEWGLAAALLRAGASDDLGRAETTLMRAASGAAYGYCIPDSAALQKILALSDFSAKNEQGETAVDMAIANDEWWLLEAMCERRDGAFAQEVGEKFLARKLPKAAGKMISRREAQEISAAMREPAAENEAFRADAGHGKGVETSSFQGVDDAIFSGDAEKEGNALEQLAQKREELFLRAQWLFVEELWRALEKRPWVKSFQLDWLKESSSGVAAHSVKIDGAELNAFMSENPPEESDHESIGWRCSRLMEALQSASLAASVEFADAVSKRFQAIEPFLSDGDQESKSIAVSSKSELARMALSPKALAGWERRQVSENLANLPSLGEKQAGTRAEAKKKAKTARL